ncbi:uncharacterized protein LOC132255531 [Phlebotomus argentipes]|uniref:uncharacterized protein LOC132255531 n=1 Tax=Phlebotomus argentipes TaxID=94469 RepID=UPI002892B11F|nr:uncharacterized protein LOC132255531 [Phlebotomus argentipes]
MTPNPLIVIFYTLCSHLLGQVAALPVTSKPLASNPDHLAWEAWLRVDSQNPFHSDMTRKITPKSIFIAPNFRNESLPCPPGFKVDHRGQCIRVVSIDPNDLLANRLQSILASTNLQAEDDEVYDYDAYDTSGPFQVNLPLSLDADSKLEQSEEARRPPMGLSTDDDRLEEQPSSIRESQRETTTSFDEGTKFTTDMSLASSEDATENITETTTLESFTTSSAAEVSSTEMLANATEFLVLEENTTQPADLEGFSTPALVTEEEEDLENSTLRANELERDEFLDVSATESTDMEESTTVSDEAITEVFTQSTTTSPTTQTVERMPTTLKPLEEKRVVIITDKFKPSRKESVLIVTPIPNVFISSTEVPLSTQFEGDKELLGLADESETEKKMREMVIQQEQKDAAMEKIDANNRFVYHHLKSPTTVAPQTTIPFSTETTVEPSTTESPASRVNHVRRTTTRPSNRIRFPAEDEDEDSPEEFKADLIRFPGPASHRFVPNMNRLIPESLTRKPATVVPSEPAQRKHAWYPPAWGRNATKQQKPVLMRFWSRMPLIRDSSFTGRRSLGHRENSKSPSDSLYKETPPQDVYRVIGARQKKHTGS